MQKKKFDKLLYVPKLNMDSLCETVILLLCVQPKGVKTGVFFPKASYRMLRSALFKMGKN